MLKKLTEWLKKTTSQSQEDLPFSLPIDEEEIFKKSKLILQQLDEYITTAELESETLSEQLDNVLSEQMRIEFKIKELNKPNSWQERSLLLKFDRLSVHGNNLKQRIELFSQNIKIYLNLMSRVEDIRVMRLNGLDTDKIQNIWLEFQTSLDSYKEKIATEAATEIGDITSIITEERLAKLRQQIFSKQPEEPKVEPKEQQIIRTPIDRLITPMSESENDRWSEVVKRVVEQIEE